MITAWKKHGLSMICLFLIGMGMLLLTGCQKDSSEEVHDFAVWKRVEEQFCTLEDGTVISKWEKEDGDPQEFLYRLEDGTDLLEVTETLTPGRAEGTTLQITSEIEGLDGLSSAALEAVTQYYEEQGCVYDLDQELEQAWTDYCQCEETMLERFQCHTIVQDVTASMETERFLVILTAVTCPKAQHFTGDTTCSYRSLIIDRESGETMDIWDLFQQEPDEAKQELAQLCASQDNTVSDEDVAAVMDQAQILLFQEYLEVWFPYGTWEKQEFDKGFGFEYEKLLGLLQDWAIPEEEKQE